jgi:hypothetical protein
MFDDLIQKTDDSISGFVGHFMSSTQYKEAGTTYKKFYTTYPVEFLRPRTGEKLIPEVCRVCGEKLEFKVRSERAVRQLKMKLRVAGFAGLALGIFLFTRLPRGHLTAWQGFQVFVFLFSFFGGLSALIYSAMEYQMSFKMKAKGKTEHELFETLKGKTVGTIPLGGR